MERDATIEILRTRERALQQRGIRRATRFDSTALGQVQAGCDVDTLIDLGKDLKRDVDGSVGPCHVIGDLFPVAVEVGDRQTLKKRIRTRIERDAVPAV
jgi:predicted nucleotidyltransferase